VGKPYPGTDLKFLDEGGFPKENVSHRDFGIIACKNDSVMSGYWKEPELTNSTIVDGYVVMADVGYRDDDGFVYLAGRRDDVIVSGGHKIAPYEVENIASQIPGVSECVCIPREDKIAGFVPVLIVAMEEGAEFSAKEIAERLAERIEGYKMPRSIHQINEMPRVGNTRKIDRRKLHDFK
jgi:acyl-coenzyme A synthetase/AMP-(fatty) acid ligase